MSEATYFVLDIDDERASAMRSFGPAGGLGTRSLTGSGGTRRAVATPLKVSAEKMTPKQVADARRGDPRRMIERAFPLRLLKPMGTPVAAAAGSSAWGLAATMADGSALDGSGVTVAVLDTGIDRTHPAFAAMGARLVTRDFTDDAGTAIDTQGHGSHCAGTIFGGDVGGTRIGIARNVSRALVGKVLPDDRPGDSAMLFKAMQWAAGENANIVSMSLGFDFPGMVAQLVDEGTPPAVATSNALVLFSRNLRGFDRLMSFFRASADMLVATQRRRVFGKTRGYGNREGGPGVQQRVETLEVGARTLRVADFELAKRVEALEKALNILLSAPNREGIPKEQLVELRKHFSGRVTVTPAAL